MSRLNPPPTYQLYIHPKDIIELRKDIWSDDPVPGTFTLNKKKYLIDIVYRGSHIRKLPKKSYHVSFYKPSLFRGAKELHLNSEYNDRSLIRNKLSLDFFSEIGVLAPHSQHVLLKINGKMSGLYLELESVDEHFLKKRQLAEGAIFYAVDGDANFSLISDLDKETKKSLSLGYERKYGTVDDGFYLEKMIYDINTLSNQEFKKEIKNIIHVDKYLRWLAGIVFTQNYDGFVHNYALYRNKETGLFELIPWDYDATWGRDVNGRYMDAGYVPIEGYNTLTARILDVDEYRKDYRNLIKGMLDQEFTLDFLQPKIEDLHQFIRPYVLMDPYVKDKIDDFDSELQFIVQFIKDRRDYLTSRLYKLE
ncbi:CotH kinase family protein [Siminovitchia sediminis]|uniref:CotH kinase family protein n=1 Tax=Siminovitchia sediminis TaxID=1274353 RepID=A0ABW4KRE0_9BACI